MGKLENINKGTMPEIAILSFYFTIVLILIIDIYKTVQSLSEFQEVIHYFKEKNQSPLKIYKILNDREVLRNLPNI